jgi:hypothetical protein
MNHARRVHYPGPFAPISDEAALEQFQARVAEFELGKLHRIRGVLAAAVDRATPPALLDELARDVHAGIVAQGASNTQLSQILTRVVGSRVKIVGGRGKVRQLRDAIQAAMRGAESQVQPATSGAKEAGAAPVTEPAEVHHGVNETVIAAELPKIFAPLAMKSGSDRRKALASMNATQREVENGAAEVFAALGFDSESRVLEIEPGKRGFWFLAALSGADVEVLYEPTLGEMVGHDQLIAQRTRDYANRIANAGGSVTVTKGNVFLAETQLDLLRGRRFTHLISTELMFSNPLAGMESSLKRMLGDVFGDVIHDISLIGGGIDARTTGEFLRLLMKLMDPAGAKIYFSVSSMPRAADEPPPSEFEWFESILHGEGFVFTKQTVATPGSFG